MESSFCDIFQTNQEVLCLEMGNVTLNEQKFMHIYKFKICLNNYSIHLYSIHYYYYIYLQKFKIFLNNYSIHLYIIIIF